MVRPRNRATKAICEPTTAGLGVFHSTGEMLAYQAVAAPGVAHAVIDGLRNAIAVL